MRRDTRELFKRLDIESFKYHEFESSSWGVDIWPMFEAILLDERVVGKDPLSDSQAAWIEAQPEPVPQPELRVPSSQSQSRSQPQSLPAAASRGPDREGIFSGYAAGGENGDTTRDKIGNRSESVRAILGRLAQAER